MKWIDETNNKKEINLIDIKKYLRKQWDLNLSRWQIYYILKALGGV